MLNKKIMIFALILLSLMTITSVGASEITDDSSNLIGSDDGILQSSSDGTFTDLSNEIANATGELVLTRNYTWSVDDPRGITINKTIDIDGKGFTINGNYQSNIFDVTASRVTLKNICFANCFGSNGGAVKLSGGEGNVINCSFVNCSADGDGGAVYIQANYCQVLYSSFADCYAGDIGGAVYWSSSSAYLENCSFYNCHAKNNAGAILFNECSAVLLNCSFSSCASPKTIYLVGTGIIRNCLFENPDTDNIYNSTKLNIYKRQAKIEAYGDTVIYADAAKAFSKLYDNNNLSLINKTVIFQISNGVKSLTFYKKTDENGMAIVDGLNNLQVGKWRVKVIFEGNDNFYQCDSTNTIYVLLANSSVSIDDINATAYQNITLVANVTSNVTVNEGIVIFFDNETQIGESPVNDGIATLVYAPSKAGQHMLTAVYNSDNYYSSNDTAILSVIKADANLTAIYTNTTKELIFTLIDSVTGKALERVNFPVIINGKGYTVQIDSRGEGRISTADLTPNNYTADAYYAGNVAYNPAKTSLNFTVGFDEVNLSAFYDGCAKDLVVTLSDAVTGNPLKGANVAVTISGVKYSVKINSKGEGRLSLVDFDYGTYAVKLTYKGNKFCYPMDVNLDVVVKDAANLSAVYSANAKELTVTLVDSATGAALKGANVIVNIVGENHNVKITSAGNAKLSLADLNSGTYNATATYKGNANYASTTIDFDVVVKDVVNLSAVYDANSKELVVTLMNAGTGNPLKGANVVVNIAGEKYNVKINSKGEGRLSLADLEYGTYEVTLTYKGNANYASTTIDLDVDIKDAVNLSAVYDDGTKDLTVSLFNANTQAPLKGAVVVVNIDGVKYKVKIDSTGLGMLSLDELAPGTYDADVTYKGSAKYYQANTSVDVIVKDD